MTLKKFSILASVVFGIILIAVVTLSCIKVDCGLGGTPDRVIAYLMSSEGTTCDLTETSPRNKEHYRELVRLYKDMTKLSIGDYMLRGTSIDRSPSQDYEKELPSWSYSNQSDNYCLELIFKDKQTTVVEIDGDTKVVEYYSLMMVVEKSTISHQVALYFSKNEDYDGSKSYSDSPILIYANQNALLKYMKYMKSTQ